MRLYALVEAGDVDQSDEWFTTWSPLALLVVGAPVSLFILLFDFWTWTPYRQLVVIRATRLPSAVICEMSPRVESGCAAGKRTARRQRLGPAASATNVASSPEIIAARVSRAL